jgi:hypothetical protein
MVPKSVTYNYTVSGRNNRAKYQSVCTAAVKRLANFVFCKYLFSITLANWPPFPYIGCFFSRIRYRECDSTKNSRGV